MLDKSEMINTSISGLPCGGVFFCEKSRKQCERKINFHYDSAILIILLPAYPIKCKIIQ